MGRTSRIYELIEEMARKGMKQGFPTAEQVSKVMKPYSDRLDTLEQQVAELEKKDKGGKKHGD